MKRLTALTITLAPWLAQAQPMLPDLFDIIKPGSIVVSGSGASKTISYTHETIDGGPTSASLGPLNVLPAYNSAAGVYQGTQWIWDLTGGNWTVTNKIPVAGAFLFDASHDHFHFPFASYGIYADNNGTPGAAVAVSGKVSFCINDSFIYYPAIPNAGLLGNLGSCTDPLSMRGLDIGASDEYDATDPGQTIAVPNLPDGIYWLIARTDPDNFFTESDKTNNQENVQFYISGTNVTELQSFRPVLNNPPAVQLSSPIQGSVLSGTVSLTANPVTSNGVTFLVDGTQTGGTVQSPYTMSWDTTKVPDGVHWLAVQETDSTGVTGTSAVAQVQVSNAVVAAPTVTITSPTAGSTVSGMVSLYANVSSSGTIANATFYADGVQVGSPVTAPPYTVSWNSGTVPDGSHSVSVTATDTLGQSGSASETVTVNNSSSPKTLVREALAYKDGSGTLTAKLSTKTAGDLVLAFVSYDGPDAPNSQTAVVSGAGLSWTLVVRSNTQAGTSEVWKAVAPAPLSSVSVTTKPVQSTGSWNGSLVVMAWTNASGVGVVGRTGMPSGAPDLPLPGVSWGSMVCAQGNDWDNAIARTPVSGQVVVHQQLAPVGDTYWTQCLQSPIPGNSLVDIHDTSPTTDRWNYAGVEIQAAH